MLRGAAFPAHPQLVKIKDSNQKRSKSHEGWDRFYHSNPEDAMSTKDFFWPKDHV